MFIGVAGEEYKYADELRVGESVIIDDMRHIICDIKLILKDVIEVQTDKSGFIFDVDESIEICKR